MRCGIGAPIAIAAALSLAAAAPSPALQCSAALVRSLGANGRAEATLRYGVPASGGGTRSVRATLALEPPSRARIDVPATGETIVARADGGEWLQPALRQLLRFEARQAAPALRWWRVLLAADRSARERSLGGGRYVLVLLSERGAPEDSAEVWLDPRGLPARLIVPAGDPEGAVYRLGGWRFTRARGEAAFRLRAPAGYESIDMP